jgi:hypothetical protein
MKWLRRFDLRGLAAVSLVMVARAEEFLQDAGRVYARGSAT